MVAESVDARSTRARRRTAAARGGAARALVPLAALLLCPLAGLHAQQGYRLGAPAGWVRPVRADLGPRPFAPGLTVGWEMLLLDRQESVGGATAERYRHIAYRLLDEGAVEEHSQIQLSFDPTYERLTLHSAAVVRDGRRIDQLRPGRIRVVRQETGLDDHLFNGTRSLVLLLEDVRKGDVVEYAYTRRGANPVFGVHYMGGADFEATVPVRALSFRLLWPAGRPLFVTRHGDAPEPAVTDSGGRREYVWTAENIPPRLLDADLPDWYYPFAWVQLSDFASWADVAGWGAALFAAPGPLPAALTARLARIRSADTTAEARALAALRFVQDEIRYVGVEIGVNAHTPYPVATVLRRRYGDCKDKALLLVTMLRALGLPAHPALVSSAYREHVRDLHPTTAEFDHAIVRTEIGGREYWLDPTALYQRGDLRAAAPPFGAALVLGSAGDPLVAIPPAPAADPVTEIAVTYELGALGKPATMRVDTRYRGRAADRTRATTRSTTPAQLQKEYTEFYAEAWPGIRSLAVPLVEDDEAANVVRTVERYEIPDFWHQGANQPGFVGTFDPLELEHAVPAATTTGRTMPLGVSHPVHYRYTITARLPGGWAIGPRTDSLATPALRFVREVAAEGEILTIRYEYETLADHVAAAAAGDHLEKVSHARRLLPFSVTPPDTASRSGWTDPRELNWPVLLAFLAAAGLAVFGAVRVHRLPAPSWPQGPAGPGEEPSGIGGWLGLVAVGVVLAPLVQAVALVRTAPAYTASAWAFRTTPGQDGYHALWAPVLLMELVGNTALVVFGCLLAVEFFRKRRWFPALFVVLISARTLLAWVDALLGNAIPAVRESGTDWSRLTTPLIVAMIWVAYMFRSRRVRNTFVN